MQHDFKELNRIFCKSLTDSPLTPLEQKTWDAWANQPHVKEATAVTEDSFTMMLEIHQRMVPWEEYLKKIEARKRLREGK